MVQQFSLGPSCTPDPLLDGHNETAIPEDRKTEPDTRAALRVTRPLPSLIELAAVFDGRIALVFRPAGFDVAMDQAPFRNSS